MPRKPKITAKYVKDFPSRLRETMALKGCTQQDLGGYLGKSRQSVAYYCDGSSSPNCETLAAIAKFLDVSSDWLLGLSDVKIKTANEDEIYKQGYEDGRQACMKLMREYVEQREGENA